MGLLGGFKAKLKGGKEKQPKSKNNNTVVCVKFHTFSEFDADPIDLPSTSQQNVEKNQVIRVKKSVVKPEITNFFNQNGISNGDIKTGQKTEAKSEARKKLPGTGTVETKSESQKKFSANKLETQKKLLEIKSAIQKTLPETETVKKSEPKQTQQKKVAAPRPPSREAIKEDTQPSSSKINSKSSDANDIYGTRKGIEKENIYEPFVNHIDDDEGNFQIHFVDYKSKSNLNVSEDETSDEEEGPQNNSNHFNYSSQAASIFFGNDEETIIMRPRNIVMDDDNISEGSSASA